MNEDSTFVAPTSGSDGLELTITGGGLDKTFTLSDGEQEYLIGRALEAEIHLPDAAVSRRHARFTRSKGRWFLEDLGSRHGTEIGGARIVASRPVAINPGERIVIRQ